MSVYLEVFLSNNLHKSYHLDDTSQWSAVGVSISDLIIHDRLFVIMRSNIDFDIPPEVLTILVYSSMISCKFNLFNIFCMPVQFYFTRWH